MHGNRLYGGGPNSKQKVAAFSVDSCRLNTDLVAEIARFFRGGPPLAALDDALEVLDLLEAAERSVQSGRPAPVNA